ncbi:hypothetical protein [Neolewinella antarctica]|uniref:SPOR domain-containing protein n=1 Tax=Neolewinella antarctica TaxID=442734 RepID=A0ABX0XGD8_9BACT|nr:hypothetical protein [Neolewinella antarctica]NJC28391.1 hypothetical protein [Neolewinella antarctica]
MRKPLFLLFSCCSLFIATSCSPKTTAGAIGEDGTDWAARAKQYKDDPAALRMFAEGCEANEARLLTAQQELTTYRSQSDQSNETLAGARTQVQGLQTENEQLRQQIATMAATKNDQVDTDKAVVQGVVFQVQLGAYAQNRVDAELATEDALELQDQNGVQKVVISQFRTYQNAAQLRDRLKVMGVTGAFIVAKNNGQRITVAEALRMAGQN